mgnify:CR=1 FL=1
MTNNPRYTLGTEANRIFMASETYELLKFGKGFPAPDGGSGWLNADGTLPPSHRVDTWLTSRMAHVYSIGAMLGYPGAGELADAALKGLTGILHDDEHGGWYPQVFADGTHAPGKVCYGHAFVILAASSALLAGRPGAKELLDEALATYDKHFWDDEIGLAVDTWNTEFTELDRELPEASKAVLLVRLVLEEVMSLSDRILVIYEGEIVGALDPKTTTAEEMGLYMAGAKRKGA